MNTNKKILYICNSLEYFLSHRLCLAREAKRRGYDVHLIASLPGDSVCLRNHDITFHPIKLYRSSLNPLNEVQSILSIYKIFKALKPDIAHLVTAKPIIYGGVIGKILGTPLLVSAVPGLGYIYDADASLKTKTLKFIVERLYKLSFRKKNHKAIFQNNANRKYMVKRKIIEEKSAYLIRGAGVDIKKFHPTTSSNNLPIILLPSRLLWTKGIGEFIEAAKIINREKIKAKFVLAGKVDKANPAMIKLSSIKQWENQKIINYWGAFPADEMPNILAKVDIVCLPSYGEGLPKSLLEAAACGLPIITTDIPGCNDIVKNSINGYLSKPRDTETLINALEKLINNPQTRKSMGRASRARICEFFSEEKIVKETFDLYLK